MALKHGKTIFAISTIAVLCIGLLGLLRGCMNSHSRPSGHGDIGFAVAPAGGQIVFNAVGEGGRDLYALDLKTKRVTRLIQSPDYEGAPAFSPDGQSIVYAAGIAGDRADHLFVCAANGSLIRQLTTEDYNDASPAFSPDGLDIVFARNLTYNWGGLASSWGSDEVICAIDPDGSRLRRLTAPQLQTIAPHFSTDEDKAVSADGKLVAFAKGKYSPDYEIYLRNVKSKATRQLTDMKMMGCFKPRFAPDGKSVFFLAESWPNGPGGTSKYSLWQIDIDGKNRHQIASYKLFDDPMNWKP